MANGRRHGSRDTSSDRSASERAPSIWTRAPADFIRARSHRAADQTPYTWPRPTNRRSPIEPLPRGSRPYTVRATMANERLVPRQVVPAQGHHAGDSASGGAFPGAVIGGGLGTPPPRRPFRHHLQAATKARGAQASPELGPFLQPAVHSASSRGSHGSSELWRMRKTPGSSLPAQSRSPAPAAPRGSSSPAPPAPAAPPRSSGHP